MSARYELCWRFYQQGREKPDHVARVPSDNGGYAMAQGSLADQRIVEAGAGTTLFRKMANRVEALRRRQTNESDAVSHGLKACPGFLRCQTKTVQALPRQRGVGFGETMGGDGKAVFRPEVEQRSRKAYSPLTFRVTLAPLLVS